MTLHCERLDDSEATNLACQTLKSYCERVARAGWQLEVSASDIELPATSVNSLHSKGARGLHRHVESALLYPLASHEVGSCRAVLSPTQSIEWVNNPE